MRSKNHQELYSEYVKLSGVWYYIQNHYLDLDVSEVFAPKLQNHFWGLQNHREFRIVYAELIISL